MAGKGDKQRPTNKTKFNENFDKIVWNQTNNSTSVKETKKVKNKIIYKY